MARGPARGSARETGRQTGDGSGLQGAVAIDKREVSRRERIARLLFALPLCLALAATPFGEALGAPKKKKSATVQPSMAACIVVDMNTGSVLHAQAADTPHYPASLTKMMTLYVLFSYMRAGKIKPSTELTVTAHAASQAPTCRRTPSCCFCRTMTRWVTAPLASA